MKISDKKKNLRREFFNRGRGDQCQKCGALLVRISTLDKTTHGIGCPICTGLPLY